MSGFDEYRRINTRQASIVHVGGFRPTNDPLASNFGLYAAGPPGQEWPASGGRRMLFVCQLNLTAAPVVPPLLADLRLIVFFLDPDARQLARENGKDWRLLAYPSLQGLVPLARPEGAPVLHKGFECRWEAADDQPNFDDPARVVPDGFDDSEVELENLARTKIGGYASTIQSEPWWDCQEHPARPAYCLQINSEEKAGLMFGDGGTLYLARGTAAGCGGEWFLDWQSY